MAEELRWFGDPLGLQIALSLEAPDAERRAEGWGQGMVYLAGEAVWTGENAHGDDTGLEWSWLDLLEFLARWWPWLALEETYPVPVHPLFPDRLRRDAEQRWENLPDETVEEEEDAVYRFLARHDLAMALKGCFVPSMLMLRQGRLCQLAAPALDLQVTRPLDETLNTLEAVGEAIAEGIQATDIPRTARALSLWRRRGERLGERAVELLSGVPAETRERLQGYSRADEFWGIDPAHPEEDTELLAAARMSTGVVQAEHQRALLERLRALPRTDTPKLDSLSERIRQAFREIGRPHAQGHWAASWLRRTLGLNARDPVDPETLLRDWGVILEDDELPDCPVEAITAWGRQCGPAVLINTAPGGRRASPHRRRSSLAHEICHLLLDREGALPAGEVLGGHPPEYPEKRARAFAAELLLPRDTAADRIRRAPSVEVAVESMERDFQVSRELIAWQIHNSDAWGTLGMDERTLVTRLRSLTDKDP